MEQAGDGAGSNGGNGGSDGKTVTVLAVATPVMALEDALQTKLLALDEHALGYSALVGITRAVREQIDWPQLRARTRASPYAEAFFTLARELGIAPREAGEQQETGARVRVLGVST